MNNSSLPSAGHKPTAATNPHVPIPTSNGRPIDQVVNRLKSGGYDPRPAGSGGWKSRCPGHDGKSHNLSVKEADDGTVLLNCHRVDEGGRNCPASAIVAGLDLELKDLFPPQPGGHGDNGKSNRKTKAKPKGSGYPSLMSAFGAYSKSLGKPTDTWPYTHTNYDLVAAVARFDPPGEKKEFRPAHRDPDTGLWHLSDPPGLWPLFNLPRLAGDGRVFFLEGEKCAKIAADLGLAATTTAHGAKSPHKTDLNPLAGREVILMPDVGPAGEGYAAKLLTLLAGLEPPARVKVVRLPGLAEDGDDIEQWLELRDAQAPEDLRAEIERLAESVEDVVSVAPPDEKEWPVLRLGKVPPALPFPLHVFPDVVAEIIRAISTAVDCDPSIAAGTALAEIGGMIGRSVNILVRENWFEPPTIFHASVADPGGGKSAAQGYLTAPVQGIERKLAEDFALVKAVYLAECKAAGKGIQPTPPTPHRALIDDSTMEATIRTLANNPRGVLGVYDELTALFTGLNQYKNGKGADRSHLLKIWTPAPISVDRVANALGEPTRVPHPALSLTGNITPGSLGLISGPVDDGMLDRWLYTMPDPKPKRKWSERVPVKDEYINEWDRIIRRLYSIRMNVDSVGKDCPHVLRFDEGGREEFHRGADQLVDEVNAESFPPWLRSPWAKMETYACRFALILTMLHHAADKEADWDELPKVSAKIAEDAWELTEHFKGEHKRIRAKLRGTGVGGPDSARLILGWIRNRLRKPEGSDRRFSGRDLSMAYPPSRGYDRAEMEDGLRWLRELNVIRLVPPAPRPPGTPGAKPSPVWEIHPDMGATESTNSTDSPPEETERGGP